jgi:hypothetical protein
MPYADIDAAITLIFSRRRLRCHADACRAEAILPLRFY